MTLDHEFNYSFDLDFLPTILNPQLKLLTLDPQLHDQNTRLLTLDPQLHGQKCETVTLSFIYSQALFEWIIDQYMHGVAILL